MERDIIIVGGGIAGLTAALTLAHEGRQVLLVEKNERCGGLMNSFIRQGFRFEGGARALVNAGLVKPLMKEFELDIQILPNPITLGIETKTVFIDGGESLSAYAELLKGLYPESRNEIDRIITAITRIIEDMKILYGVDNPLFTKSKKNILTLIPSAMAWGFKFIRTMYRITKLDVPFEDYLDGISANQSLKDIIGQHFFRNTPVFFALSYFALYNDYIYPQGGVGAFMEALESAILKNGGEIQYETEIARVDADRKTLTDSAGEMYRYTKLIWAADLKTLYANSTAGESSRKERALFAQRGQAIRAAKGAESVFTVFAAVDQPPEEFAKTATGHVFYTPERRGLGQIHTTEVKELLARWDRVSREEVYHWLRRFCRYNTFEISIPALRDPDAAPAGKSGLIISTLFDYELTRKIQDAGWYEEFKKAVEKAFIETIASSLYPGLKDRILFTFSASPLSIYNRVASSEGSIVGWSFTDTIPVVSSMFRMADAVKTALPDVYAAGKWVYSPAGGPTAIMTGRMAAKRCLKS